MIVLLLDEAILSNHNEIFTANKPPPPPPPPVWTPTNLNDKSKIFLEIQ